MEETKKEARARIQDINDRMITACQEMVNCGLNMKIKLTITFSDGDVATKTFTTEKGTLQ